MAKRIGATLFVMSLMLLLVGGMAFADASASNNGKVPEGKGKPSGPTDSTEITTAGNPNQDCDGDSGGNSDTGNGANQGDAYDNTCDPDYEPMPGNGDGNGERVGIPCTGCVGQADDKNPQGQMPDASDSNNGYECDGNNGIAKGNPAHTTCSSSLTQDNPPQDNPPTTDVLGSGGTRPPTQVLGVQLSKEPGATEVLGVAMARTGIEAIPLSLVALALMGIGIALMNSPRPLRTTV